MNREKMENDRVSRFEFPTAYLVIVSVLINVRHRYEAGIIVFIIYPDKFFRGKPLPPLVGTGNEFRTGFFWHRIQRDPKAAYLVAIDTIVRLIMVPGSRLIGSRFLDQNMFVEDSDFFRAHQFCSKRSTGGFIKEMTIFRNPVPVAVISKKISAFIFTGVDP